MTNFPVIHVLMTLNKFKSNTSCFPLPLNLEPLQEEKKRFLFVLSDKLMTYSHSSLYLLWR